MAEDQTSCPFCKEDIKPDAIKCKHCGSSLKPSRPSHEGTCPYCKESIHPEAVKCKHCQTMLLYDGGCQCEGAGDLPPDARLLSALLRDVSGTGPTISCDGKCRWAWIDCMFAGRDKHTCDIMEAICRVFCQDRLLLSDTVFGPR